MILKLIAFQLPQIILGANHVLNKLSYFLVQLDDVGSLMNKFLNLLPIRE